MTTTSATVAANNDDGHYNDSGSFVPNADELNSNFEIYVRFINIDVPQGAIINSASVTFTSSVDKDGSPDFEFAPECEDAGNATQITSDNDGLNRPRTVAAPTQAVPETVDGQTETFDCTDPVQAVVNRSDWASGNALQVFVTNESDNTYSPRFTSFDAGLSGERPQLTVDYSPSNTAPTADAGADQIVTEGDTVQLDGTASLDLDGDTLSYEWTVVDDGGTGLTDSDITDRLTATPTFTAPPYRSG